MIRDDPLELFTQIEKLIHVPKREIYPTLDLIKTLTLMMAVKQHDQEKLLTYLERFKSERDVVKSLFGNQLLNCHIECTEEYLNIDYFDAADLSKQKKEMKSSAMAS